MPGDLWNRLPAHAQDALVLLGLLALPGVLGVVITRGFAPAPLLGGILRRHRWTCAIFVALVALSVGLGVGITAQERGLRQATARIADRFDLIVAAPGDEISMLLATVYLQPTDAALLDGHAYQAVANAPGVGLAAPLAYGDSWQGAPIIGSTAQFVTHLSGALAEGRMFQTETEAIAGASVPLALNDRFAPAHGHGPAADDHAHAGFDITVTGRMAPTGSPWDKALIVPVESVWSTHGLTNGHAIGDTHLGPPFTPALFPGTPAIIVTAPRLSDAYGLQAQFSTERTMAFFPGATLTRLHGLMGDLRAVLSVLSLLTQVLVAAAVLAGLAVLVRLFARRLALLRALGAPARMVFALVWSFAATLLGLGGVLGLGVGLIASRILSLILSAQTDLLIRTSLSWPELHLIAAFLGLASLVALVPAALALLRPIPDDLRTG